MKVVCIACGEVVEGGVVDAACPSDVFKVWGETCPGVLVECRSDYTPPKSPAIHITTEAQLFRVFGEPK